jgi:molybdopterin synthase catalytic subunit
MSGGGESGVALHATIVNTILQIHTYYGVVMTRVKNKGVSFLLFRIYIARVCREPGEKMTTPQLKWIVNVMIVKHQLPRAKRRQIVVVAAETKKKEDAAAGVVSRHLKKCVVIAREEYIQNGNHIVCVENNKAEQQGREPLIGRLRRPRTKNI